MGMTAVEKILARASGVDAVRPGDIVFPKPDFVMVHDGLVASCKEELDELGIDRAFDPDRLIFVSDHNVLYTDDRALKRGFANRQVAADWGVKRFYDAGQGGHGHIFPMERGIVTPGTFYFDHDRHCTSVGGIGAFALRCGAEIITVLATGTLWTQVPATVRLALRGKPQAGVFARDIGFKIAAGLREGGAFGVDIDYRVLELDGDLSLYTLGDRVALTNSATEMRAVGVFVPPSEDIIAYSKAKTEQPFDPVFSDEDAEYQDRIELDVSKIAPQVALTGGVENGVDVKEVEGTAIHHAFIGSCGSGSFDDLAMAARVLKGRRIANGVRLFVVPGTEDSMRRAVHEGLMETFYDAGAFVLPAGCGLCSGAALGPVHAGEVSISTAAGNNRGRFGGDVEAEMYLASPATVAASAVRGRVTDPRTLDAVVTAEGGGE